MTIHRLFTLHIVTAIHVFSKILDLIEAEQSIYQNVQYFIWSSVFNLLQLDILCTNAVKRCYN